MKKVYDILPSFLVGALFLFGGLNYFFNFVAQPPIPGDPGVYMGIMMSSGMMTVVKVLEVIGGALILFPDKRALGLTILAPITVNILLFELCLAHAPSVGVALTVLSAIIAYQQKDKFKALL
jgi:putative oxidoreductase